MSADFLSAARSLAERVDLLEHHLGGEIAQTFVPSGDPSGDTWDTSFSDFAKDIRARACALTASGIARDDRVAMMTPLGFKSYPTLYAAMIAATAVPLNYFLEAPALIRLIIAAGATALIAARHFEDDPASFDKIQAIAQALPDLKIFAYGDGPDKRLDAVDLDTMAARYSGRDWAESHPATSGERLVAIFHTGGTTGRPKLVPHTEARFQAMLRAGGEAMGIGPGERMLAALPLFHVSGAVQMGLQSLFNGCSIVIPSPAGFRGPGVIANYWNFIARFRATLVGVVPTVLMRLADMRPDGDVSSLKAILCGGAPLPLATIEAVTRNSGGAVVVEGWGMTETCGFSIINPRDRTRVGTVGLPFTGVEVEVRPLDGSAGEVGKGVVGELVVRGDSVITSYLDGARDSFTANGWLRTGDLARQDPDGYFSIVGRAKDLIIRSGHNIDPGVIETPAYEHPAVELAAAIGRPDRYAGEVPILYVQLRAGARLEPEELREFLAARIEERAALPKAVHIVETIPLSGPGKIHKLSLRREAIRAALQAEADSAHPGATVSVVEDERHGLAISIAGPADARLAAIQALTPFSFTIFEEA